MAGKAGLTHAGYIGGAWDRDVRRKGTKMEEKIMMPRLLLGAPGSGSGKTMLTMGLLAAFAKRGLRPFAFKCGPDYIDPMFHTRVIGAPAKNLDGYFTGEETTRMLFGESFAGQTCDLALIEGVMGYYDGAGLCTDRGSSFELARTLLAPAVLVVDARGLGQSVLALVEGFVRHRADSRIAGVVFNRMSARVYEVIEQQVRAHGIRPLGYVPVLSGMELKSRHLGLVTPGELSDLRGYVDELAQAVEQTVDLDGLLALAGSAPALAWEKRELPRLSKPLRVSVARDEAFCFLYEDNLRYLRGIGAELSFFSPLRDERLPERTDVLLFPGGYPELYAGRLSENSRMRSAVRSALEGGAFVLAECGGFLYLTKELADLDGKAYPMVGWIDARSFRTERPGRFGYVELTPNGGGEGIRGHEFHYYDTTGNGWDFTAKKPFRDISWTCMHASVRGLAGFPHLYYYSNPAFLAERLEAFISVDNEEKSHACMDI